MQRHIQQVHYGARPFECPDCGQVLTRNLFFKKSVTSFPLPTLILYFQCFKSKGDLNNHIKYVHPTDESSVLSKCGECGKVIINNTKHIEHLIP